jgi:hypothetical protein
MPRSEENKLLPFMCPHCGVTVRITNKARHLRYASSVSATKLLSDTCISFFRSDQHGIEPKKPEKKTKHVCDDVTLCGCGKAFLQKSLLDKHLLAAMEQARPSAASTDTAIPLAHDDKDQDAGEGEGEGEGDSARPKKKQAVESKAPEEEDMMSYIATTLCAIQNQTQTNESASSSSSSSSTSSSSSSSSPATASTTPEHAARLQAFYTKYAQAARIRSLQCLTLEAKIVEVEQQLAKFRASLASARAAHVAELSNVESATAQLVLHGVPLPSVALLQPAKNATLGKPPTASRKKRARDNAVEAK